MPTTPASIQTRQTHNSVTKLFEFESVIGKPNIIFTKIDSPANNDLSDVAIATHHVADYTYMTSAVFNRTEESFGEYSAAIINDAGSANFKVSINRPEGILIVRNESQFQEIVNVFTTPYTGCPIIYVTLSLSCIIRKNTVQEEIILREAFFSVLCH